MFKFIVLLVALVAVTQGEFVSNDSTYPSLPNEQGSFKSRICIFIETDTINEELGIIYLNLAETLTSDGHDVTILVNEPLSETDAMSTANLKVRVVPSVDLQHEVTPADTWRSYEIYQYLRTQTFDVIHFADWKGNAYFSVMAKHQGLAFDHTMFVIGAQAPYVWTKVNNFERVKDTKPLELDFMQRLSIQYADVVVSPSEFMLNWLSANGWTLPEKTYVEPNIVVNSRIPVVDSEDKFAGVTEVVFYGDLMPCQGLVLFCDALDKLSETDLPEDFTVRFLGKVMDVQGIDARTYIEIRAGRWSFDYSIVEDKDRFESLRYMSVGTRLAVVAPEQANAPLRLQELMLSKIPFLASDVGGIREMVDEQSVNEVLFRPRFDKLAEKIYDAVTKGVRIASFAKCPVEVQKEWAAFHSALRAETVLDVPLASPLVSVCITHYNRPAMLRQAVASIERQTYGNIEVILVDDASTDAEAVSQIEDLKDMFAKRGWKIIVLPENSYLGKARNVAVQEASGEYVLFLDDDNVAMANEVETFVRAALNGGADLLTSVQYFFSGPDMPIDTMTPNSVRVPLGGDVATGFFWNCFGDANSFVKRSAFLEIGGFTEDYKVGYEDYEFFAKAVLKGYTLEVVPEALFWYRRAYDTMSFSTPLYKNRMRYLRPYMENLSPSMSNLFLYVQSMHYDAESPLLPAMQNCSAKTTCDECKNSSHCGWCEATKTCDSGDQNQSAHNCTIAQGWSYGNETACVTCSGACENCTKNLKCGYCTINDNCEIAGQNGAIYNGSPCHNNATEFITGANAACPNEGGGKDKTKLIIIIVCSVGGGLLLFAAVALVTFFWYQRTQRPGYTPINQG